MDASRGMARWLCAMVVILVATAAVQAQEPAAKEAAAPAATAIKVPDGTPDVLFKFIEETENSDLPPNASREVQLEHLIKVGQAVAEACKKILDQPAEEAQVVEALQKRLAALELLNRIGNPTAADELSESIKKYSEDKRPAVVGVVRPYLIQQRLEASFAEAAGENPDPAKLAAAARDAWQEFDQMLTPGNKPDAQLLRLALTVVGLLQHTEQTELAITACKKCAEFFRASDNEQIVSYAERFDGLARQLDMVGKPLDIEGTLVDGQKFEWSKYAGKVVLVDFWATWCGPCVAELPNVKANYEKYHDRGFDVIGISLDQDRAALEQFIKEKAVPWPILFDENPETTGWNHPMARRYGVSGIPMAILVNQKGEVVTLEARGEELGELLAKLLGDEPVKQ